MASHSNKDGGFGKIEHYFLLVLNSNFWSNSLRFLVIKHFNHTGNDVIAISHTRWRRTKFKLCTPIARLRLHNRVQ